jgi:hypothetical protein
MAQQTAFSGGLIFGVRHFAHRVLVLWHGILLRFIWHPDETAAALFTAP